MPGRELGRKIIIKSYKTRHTSGEEQQTAEIEYVLSLEFYATDQMLSRRD